MDIHTSGSTRLNATSVYKCETSSRNHVARPMADYERWPFCEQLEEQVSQLQLILPQLFHSLNPACSRPKEFLARRSYRIMLSRLHFPHPLGFEPKERPVPGNSR